MVHDLLVAARGLRKSPAFTIAAIATLALGIGANASIFQLIDAVRLRNLPVTQPERLARLQIRGGNSGFGITHDERNLTKPVFDEIERRHQAFTHVFAWVGQGFRIGEKGERHRVEAILVTGDYFPALDIPPAAGRLLRRADDSPGCAAPPIVISQALWQREFGAEPAAIGRRLVVEDHPLEIVGVVPERFTGLEVGNRFDIAVPLCAGPLLGAGSETRADVFSLKVLGRLNPGWTVQQASEHVLSLSPAAFDVTAPSGYSAKSIERFRNFRLEAVPAANGVSFLRDDYDRALQLLLGITGLVLVLACANLANLTLARAAGRGREFAVRLALGASRSRLIRACLSESLLLAALGAAAGLFLAGVLSRSIANFLRPPDDPLTLDLSLDWRVLAFSIVVAAAASAIFGLAPALRAVRVDPGVAIKAGGRGSTGDRAGFRFQRALVVAQVSVSLMLVVGALLFVRSFRNLLTLDPGFRTDGVLLGYFDAGSLKIPPREIRAFHERLLNDVRSVPQVESAASTTNIPIGGGSWSLGVHAPGGEASSKFTWVSAGYFATLGIPLIAGRDFTARDSEGAPKVVVVNRRFAARFFGGANPVGKRFWTAEEPHYPPAEYEIVGLIPDSRYYDLRNEPPAIAYAPWNQHPSLGPWAPIFVHTSAPLAAVRAAIQERVSRSYPGVEMEFRVFEDQVRGGLLRDRLMAALAGFFGVLAALVASVGLYGVMAYFVVRRRHEIGIRMALGAGRGQVAGLVLKDALRMLAAGVVLGAAGALALGETASSLLFGLKPTDPVTFAAAIALLALAAGFGSLLPARRAAGLDPMVALRHD